MPTDLAVASQARNRFFLHLLLAIASIVFIGCAEVINPSAHAKIALAPDRENELVVALKRFAEQGNLRLRGHATKWETREGLKAISMMMDFYLYRGEALILVVSGSLNPGEYVAFAYANPEPDWQVIWERLITHLKSSLGQNIEIKIVTGN